MAEPFLILHKVRGESAFDIAIKMIVIDEVWWIIPTSGHRAYPYWWDELKICCRDYVDIVQFEMPSNLIDHYDSDPAPKGQGAKLDISALINAHRKPMEDRRF